MNAVIRYLDAIASALEKMRGKGDGKMKVVKTTSSSSASSSASADVSGSVNTAPINEKLKEALVVTEGEEPSITSRSVYDVIRENVETKLTEALFITVTEEQTEVEQSVFEAIRDDLIALSPHSNQQTTNNDETI